VPGRLFVNSGTKERMVTERRGISYDGGIGIPSLSLSGGYSRSAWQLYALLKKKQACAGDSARKGAGRHDALLVGICWPKTRRILLRSSLCRICVLLCVLQANEGEVEQKLTWSGTLPIDNLCGMTGHVS